MQTVHRSVLRSVLAAMLALVASPVLAQAPEEPSTRASLMETARETLATRVRAATAVGHRTGSVLVRQPVPVREAVRRMERHPSRRRRLPGRRRSQVRHRLRQGTDVGRSGSTPPQPRRPHGTRSVQHQGLRPSQCRRERTQSRWFARSTSACPASTTSSRRRTSSALGWTASSRTAPTTSWTQLRAASPSDGSPRGSNSAAASRISGHVVGRGTDNRFLSTDDLFTAAAAPGLGSRDRLSEGRTVRSIRLARQPQPIRMPEAATRSRSPTSTIAISVSTTFTESTSIFSSTCR